MKAKSHFFKNTTISSVLIKSICSAWALLQITGLHAMNLLAFLFLLLCMIFFKVTDDLADSAFHKEDHYQKKISHLAGTVFTFLYLLANYSFIIKELTNPFFRLCILIITSIGLFYLFSNVVLFGISLLTVHPFQEHKAKETTIRILPIFCFFFCILCRIPYFLYSFPGILTPDSINQFDPK